MIHNIIYYDLLITATHNTNHTLVITITIMILIK